MIRRSFQDLLKLASTPLYGALAGQHLECGIMACSPNLAADVNKLERTQKLPSRLVTGLYRFPYEERLLWMGLHALQR